MLIKIFINSGFHLPISSLLILTKRIIASCARFLQVVRPDIYFSVTRSSNPALSILLLFPFPRTQAVRLFGNMENVEMAYKLNGKKE